MKYFFNVNNFQPFFAATSSYFTFRSHFSIFLLVIAVGTLLGEEMTQHRIAEYSGEK